MKYILCLILAASFLLAGCSTPNKAENTAIHLTKVEVTSIVSAMRAFVEFERQYGASLELRTAVDNYYQKVRQANLAAEGLWIAYKDAAAAKAENAPVLLTAYQNSLQAVAMASAELIAFVVAITTK